jgi:hypothetical protein
MPAIGVLCIAIGLGPDSVVEIAGVRPIDGDQRYVAQVGPLAERCGF